MEKTPNQFIPVTLIKGFLEAGKSTYINSLFKNKKKDTGTILLLSLEEGEVSYNGSALEEKGVALVELEEESCLNRDNLERISSLYNPSGIVIECNAMWKMPEFEFPRNWQVTKRIAVLCGPTLGLYLYNMRSFMGPMLSRCDRIIINRCEDLQMLAPVKSKLRPLLDDISVAAIESGGSSYPFDSIQDLVPYSLDAEVIAVTPASYVFWFYDCQDHQSRYEGRRVSLDADIKKSPVLKTGDFALGKIAITCCEADMSFLGYIAHYDSIDSFSQYDNVHAEAVINYTFMQQYKRVMPYLQITHMELSAPDNHAITF